MDELWKQIEGYEGLYEVSNFGRVRSLKRHSTLGKVLKLRTDKDGYKKAHLSKNNKAREIFVHRLVAVAFIENHNPNHTVVNHKNEIKDDNRADNLEWCDVAYNTNYNGATIRRGRSQRTPVVAIKGDERVTFTGITEAAEALGVTHGNISGCLLGYRGRKTLKGYRFEYAYKISQQKSGNQ